MEMTIKEVLVKRDGYSPEDADFLIEEAKEDLQQLIADDRIEEAYLICQEYFGLEPDYIMELL